MQPNLLVPGDVLADLLAHAASAARLIGHLDGAIAAGPLGDHIDALVHELTELLGGPLLATPVLGTCSTVALDIALGGVPEHVEPDASAASRTISIAIVPHRSIGGAP